MPSAEKHAGCGGTITRGLPMSRAMAPACSGPPPPKATSEACFGSTPPAVAPRRSASAKGEEGTLLRLAPARGPPPPQRERHVRVGDRDDAGRGLLLADAEGPRDLLGDRAARGVDVELHLAAEVARRVDAREHDVRVGH